MCCYMVRAPHSIVHYIVCVFCCSMVARSPLSCYYVSTIRSCHTWTTNCRMPVVIHILFFSLRTGYCVTTIVAVVVVATDTATSSLSTHTHTFHFFCAIRFLFPFTRKLIYFYFFFGRHLTNIFHFGILCMGKNLQQHTHAYTHTHSAQWHRIAMEVLKNHNTSPLHTHSHDFYFDENKIWKKIWIFTNKMRWHTAKLWCCCVAAWTIQHRWIERR